MELVKQSEALEALVADEKNPHEKVRLLNQLAKTLYYTDSVRCLAVADEAFALATKFECVEGQIESLNHLAWANMLLAKFDQSIIVAGRALSLSRKHNQIEGEAQSLNHLGRSHMYLGNYGRSIEMHLEELAIVQSHDLPYAQAVAFNGLGNACARIGEIARAADYYERARVLFEMLGEVAKSIGTTINKCYCYSAEGECERTIETMLRLLPQIQEYGLKHHENWAYRLLGDAYFKMGDLGKATQYHAKNVSLGRRFQDKQQELESLVALGEIALDAKSYAEAEAYLLDSVRIAQQHDTKSQLYEAHALLARLFEERDEPVRALAHYKLFHQLKEVVFESANEQRLQAFEALTRVEQAELESELYRQETVKLEAMVATRTQELAELNDELRASLLREEELSRMRSQIISSVSHEFRTPLTVLSNSTDLLVRHFDQLSAEKVSRIAQRVETSIADLTTLLQSISIVDSHHNDLFVYKPKEIVFSDLFRSVVESLKKDNLVSPLLVSDSDHIDDAQPLFVDESMLTQVVTSLIENAYKYSDEGQVVHVKVWTDDVFHCTVSDDGIGVHSDDLEKLGQLFYRGRNVGTRRGLGLGLAIARRLLGEMGGTLSAESAGLNQGSQFTFTLPLVAVKQQA